MNYGRAGLLEGLDKSAKLIEIGPSYNPTAPKSAGWKTTVVDHATREALIAKYAPDPSVDPKKIEEVDFVWQGGFLAELIPEEQHGTYDGFIACHVIEHTTDIVRFLQSAERLLSDDGEVLLVVPDKRKCFDFFRPVSMTSDALVAYNEKRQRHTAKTHFENAMYVSHRNGCPAWFDTETAPSTLGPPLSSALAHMKLSERPDYVDAHGWTFTPASFELMMLELAAMGFLNITVVEVREAPATEFSARLKKGKLSLEGSALEDRRLELLNRMVIEIADQSRQILGSPMASHSCLQENLRAQSTGGASTDL